MMTFLPFVCLILYMIILGVIAHFIRKDMGADDEWYLTIICIVSICGGIVLDRLLIFAG